MNPSPRRSRSKSRDHAAAENGVVSLPGLLLPALIGALLIARLLVPAEAAALGKTLWITQLWLAAGLVWLWAALREGRRSLRLDWLDAAVWTVVAGHAVSALFVVTRSDGQPRAALTGLWEWVGLGVAFFLVRQVIRTFDEGRRLALVLVAMTVALAGLGLWQHYVWYPRIIREYAAVRTELDQLTSAPRPATAAEAQQRSERIEQLRYELTRQNVPLERPGLVLFESRLRASSEPFGTFSLTNSFAGLLVAWLIVGAAMTVHSSRRPTAAGRTGRGRWALIVAFLALALIAFCLVLTKSRTAWVGLIVGLVAWAGLRLVRGGTLSPRWIGWTAGVAAVALAAFALAGLSGGFDREVLLEAPKSLSYRLQYWTGAIDVLRERPLLGTGPGNFRQHYLHFKPPEASEEIADPHNAVLDLWTSGGVIALAGAVWLIMLLCRRVRFANAGDAPTPKPTAEPSQSTAPWSSVTRLTVGAALGFGLIVLLRLLLPGDLLLTGGSTMRDLALAAGWLVAMLVFARAWSGRRVPGIALGAAGVGLLVHLLGAGGIEMPAITQTLLVLVAIGTATHAPGEPSASLVRPAALVGFGAVLLGLFAGCLLFGLKPVLVRDALLMTGDVHRLEGNAAEARRLYAQAADADPLSPEPLERLAGMLLDEWWSQSSRDRQARKDDRFDRAMQLFEDAARLDPHGPRPYRQLGRWWLTLADGSPQFAGTEDHGHAATAARWLERAVLRYPSHAQLRAEFARALQAAGRFDEARDQARIALRIEEINRRHGHTDRYLSSDDLARLQAWADENAE